MLCKVSKIGNGFWYLNCSKNIEKPEKPFKFDGLSWLIIILLSNIWQFGVCIAFFDIFWGGSSVQVSKSRGLKSNDWVNACPRERPYHPLIHHHFSC